MHIKTLPYFPLQHFMILILQYIFFIVYPKTNYLATVVFNTLSFNIYTRLRNTFYTTSKVLEYLNWSIYQPLPVSSFTFMCFMLIISIFLFYLSNITWKAVPLMINSLRFCLVWKASSFILKDGVVGKQS